jgi:hypothetical protein
MKEYVSVTTATHLQALYSGISQERIETYRPIGSHDLDMTATYLYNIALCEAFYTPLNFLEITLRNALHMQLSAFYGSTAWYLLTNVLEPGQQNDVVKVTRRIVGRGKQATPGRVVSELNFGFWVSLLSGAYETRFWRPNRARVLKASFPNIPKSLRQRTTIYKRYNELREFRNRVFHHEPIWNRASLSDDYTRIYEAIDWIDPEMVDLSTIIDRYSDVVMNGQTRITNALVATGKFR